METRTKEFAWVAKLSGDSKLVKWSGKTDGTLEQIVLKLAVLGPGAKAGERNIVEITTFDSEQAKVKSCICSLGIGKTENQQLCDISLYPPVHFALVEGSGPVHISANHMLLDEDDLSDEEDMSDYEEEMEDIREKLQARKKVDGKGDGPKKTKAALKQEEDDDDLDDDLEDDEDDEDSLNVDDFLDMEAENEDEISDEDEEEEKVEIAPKKRKLANGQAKSQKSDSPAKNNTTPGKSKQKKPEEKTPKSAKNDTAQKTPKSEKKTPAKLKFNSVEDVKAAIKKYPGGKPRKQDKFTNWLENQFKVEQDSWKNDLWMWHKKQQGL